MRAEFSRIHVVELMVAVLLLAALAACGGGGEGGGGGASLSGRLTVDDGGAFKPQATPVETEPNDAVGSGQDLGALAMWSSLTVRGHVDASDARDGFRLLVPDRSTVTVAVAWESADAACEIVALDPTTMTVLGTFRGDATRAEGTLAAKGALDVVVAAARGATDYVLTVSAAAIEVTVTAPAGAASSIGEVLPGDRIAGSGSGTGTFLVGCPAPVRLVVRATRGTPVALRATDAAGAPLGAADDELAFDLAGAALVSVEAVAQGDFVLDVEGAELPPGVEGVVGAPAPADENVLGSVVADVVPNRALVLPKPGDERAAERDLAASGCRVLDAIPGGAWLVDLGVSAGIARADATRATVARARALSRCASLAYAEPDARRRAFATPNDPRYADQWHYSLIHLPEAWDVTTGSDSVIVAVIDTGQTNHPDLAGRLTTGYDFISDASNAADGNGRDADPTDVGDGVDGEESSFHGTHVAGTIGAATNNGVGVAGVTWRGKVMHLRVLGKDGGDDFDIANAILYAARLANASGTLPASRAHVINMSLGGGEAGTTLADAVAKARAAGVVIVAAAGNESTSQLSYPAAYDGVIAVGAVDRSRGLASYSNFGSWVDLVAPGGDGGGTGGVLSTLRTDAGTWTYDWYEGTSMATPHVCGVAALVIAANPALTGAQVESILLATAEDLGTAGRDNTFGYGLVNAYAAVVAATGGVVPPLPPAPPPGPGPGPDPSGETIYVLAVEAESEEVVAEAYAGGSLAFVVGGLPPGSYYLAAGTDRDGDGDITNEGELFGLWPDVDDPWTIDLGAGEARTGLDFVLVDSGLYSEESRRLVPRRR